MRAISMRGCIAGLTGLAALTLGLAVPAQATTGGAVVRTDLGLVGGQATSKAVEYKGIPYAAPPVGDKRWKAPQPAKTWTGVRDATQSGNRCPQPVDAVVGTPASTTEDCLNLNVTTPRHKHGKATLPVMVWIHGGGMRTGSGSDSNEQRLADQGDVVVVSINYRLGILGFFAHPGLDGGGTFGLQDQQAALRWVQRNAKAFGGNSRNVTIFGVSAGSDGVCSQLASPQAKGLFSKAIMQSGSCTKLNAVHSFLGAGPRLDTFKDRAVAEDLGVEARAKLGCTDVECLRQAKVADLLAATDAAGQQIYWSPTVGTKTLPVRPTEAFASGTFNRVPVIAGTTRDEGTLFVQGFPPLSKAEYDGFVDFLTGPSSAAVKQHYAYDSYPSFYLAFADFVTDRTYACTMDATRQLLAKHVPTYGYEFADRNAPNIFELDPPPPYPFGAYHGSDIPYVHGGDKPVDFTPAQRKLSHQLIAYWSNFAKAGTPDGHTVPRWKRYQAAAGTPYVQSFESGHGGIGPVDFDAEHACSLWSSIDTY